MPQPLPGVGQRGVQECIVPARWVMLTRPRRVTKRVGGVKTPQPYQRRRKSLIQRHLLQIPGRFVSLLLVTLPYVLCAMMHEIVLHTNNGLTT